MKDFIQLIRPKQWIKNGFIFFPAFFASVNWEAALILKLIGGFAAYSIAASAVYIMNDWFDAPLDRLHPEKKDRPIASGRIGTERVGLMIVILLTISLIISGLIVPKLAMYIMAYFGINVAYSAGLKNFPILDVMVIAVGFILRILCGGVIAEVPLSFWIIIVTFFLALFLAFAKRRHDFILFRDSGKITRKSISMYSMTMINVGIIFSSIATLVFYFLYTISPAVTSRISEHLYITAIFVLGGLVRYYYLIFAKNLSGKPTQILYKDLMLQLIILSWMITFAILIYG